MAVHGLGGDVFKTLTHANAKLWLQDLLPHVLNTARIMTFGYDMNVFTKPFTQRSFVFAETLLSKLKDKRTGSAVRYLIRSMVALQVADMVALF